MKCYLYSLITVGTIVLMFAASVQAKSNKIKVPYPPGWENLYGPSSPYHYPDSKLAIRLAYSTPGKTDTKNGARHYKIWYQTSQNGGKTYDKLRPLIQHGKQFNRMHPIRPVYINKNSFVYTQGITTASNGEMLLPFYYWPLNKDGKLAHVKDAYTYTAVGVLAGQWIENGSDIRWSLGETIHLDYKTQSRRGAMEPAIVELKKPGHFLMILRASNGGDLSIASYKWKCVSTDYCKTWSKPVPFTYADGTHFYSPSSWSNVVRNHYNGRLYWFGNICPENANGNYPRYPLVIGEIDPKTLGLIKSTVRIIDTRDPSIGDTKKVQFSNFSVRENRKTGDFIVGLNKYDWGKLKPGEKITKSGWPRMRYVIPLHGKIKTTRIK